MDLDRPRLVPPVAGDVDGRVPADLELVGEGFGGEELGEAGGEGGGVESEERGDGGVDLVVLRGHEEGREVSYELMPTREAGRK